MILAIHLTDEQRQTIESRQGQPVEVIDPATNRVYVLVGAETFERVRALLEQPAAATVPEHRAQIAPQMLQSMQGYWRDLPELLKLKSRKHRWVGYQGDQRICTGRTDLDVYQECFRRGLRRGEFYVGKLEADPEGIPPWGTHEGDRSLYEATADEGSLSHNIE
jgi:hypothetical protein